MRNDVPDKIVSMYKGVQSIKTVSKTLGVCEGSVRRVLIQAGEYTSPRHQEVLSLYEQGLDVNQIAQRLSISRNTVINYLPYRRKPYICEDKSENAIRIRRWREKGARGAILAKAHFKEAWKHASFFVPKIL